MCVAVSPVGGACSVFPAQLCATGVECSDDGVCEVPSFSPLALGDVCVESFTLLGECVGGFCDLLGSERCEPLRGDGERCEGGDQCVSGGCEGGVCGAVTFCGGF